MICRKEILKYIDDGESAFDTDVSQNYLKQTKLTVINMMGIGN